MRLTFLLSLACMIMSVTQAADISSNEQRPAITLQQVINRVVDHNPQFSIHAFDSRAASARIQQVEQSNPLSLKLGLENFAGRGDYQGSDSLETTLSLSKLLTTDEQLSSRRDLAQQQLLLLRNEQDSQRLDLFAQVAEQFIHVVEDQHRLGLAGQHLTLVQQTHAIVTRRVAAGRSHSAEQRRLDIELARAEIEREHAEHELSSSRVRLAGYFGEYRDAFGNAHGELFNLPVLTDFQQLETLLKNNPDLVRFATKQRIARAQVRLAQSRRSANLELAGGIRYHNDSNDPALVASISIPFGSGSRARPHIEEMQALSSREPLRFEQQRLLLHASLYELYQEALHARTAYEMLQQRIIPAAEQASADYKKGYQNGRFSLLELNEAQGELLAARLEAVKIAANFHRLKIEIERLTGAALDLGE